MITDRYPPPSVWRDIDAAAQRAEELQAEGREIAFSIDDSGQLAIALMEGGSPVRELSVLETLAVAGGAPL